MEEYGYSFEFIELIKYAKRQGARMIRLDRDAEELLGRYAFNW